MSAIEKAQIATICRRNDITRPEDIEKAYNNYVEGKSIFDGLSEGYQRASAFGRFLANGGHLYGGETEPTSQMDSRPSFPWIEMARQEEQAYQNAMQEPYFQVNGRISKDEWRERNKPRDPGQITQSKYSSGPVGLGQMIDEYVREAKHRANNGELMLHGKYGLPLAGLAAGAGAAAGSVLPTILANPYVDAGLVSMGGAHAAQSIANGEADWMTALELAPMVRPAKAMYQAAKPFVGPIVEQASEGLGKARTFLGSPATGKWTQFGNKEYRFEPGKMFEGLPINRVESRPALPKWAENNPLWAPTEDGALVNTKTGQRFVLNPEGKWQSETSLNITNNEMAKKAAKEAAKEAEIRKSRKAINNIISNFEKNKITGFSTDEWKAFRNGFKTTDADIKEYESHLQEYYEIFEELKRTGQLSNKNGKWEGLVNGKMVPVNARQYIRAHSKNFIDNGWKYDGFDRGTAMEPEVAEIIQDNGGLGATNWTTNNNTQLSIFSQERDNGPILRGIVSTRSIPDRIAPAKYAHEADWEKYNGITAFDGPVGLVKHPEITGDWKLFGRDMLVKAIDGNNGLYSRIIKNPLSGIIPPVGIGYIANEAIEDINENNRDYGF